MFAEHKGRHRVQHQRQDKHRTRNATGLIDIYSSKKEKAFIYTDEKVCGTSDHEDKQNYSDNEQNTAFVGMASLEHAENRRNPRSWAIYQK